MPRQPACKPRRVRAARRPVAPPIRLSAGAAATFVAAAGNNRPRRFAGVAYTGAPMKPEGWVHPIIVDLDGVEVPKPKRPVLRQHDHNRVLGHTDKVAVSQAKGIEVEGPFSGHPSHTDEVLHAGDNGFEWELSIGADPLVMEDLKAGATATVNGREVTGPMTISRKTKLGEVSIVPLGADGDTSVSVHASGGSEFMKQFRALLKAAKAAGNILAAKFSDEEIDNMDEQEAKAALKKYMAGHHDDEDEDDDKPAEGHHDEDEDEDEDEDKPAKAKKAKGHHDADKRAAAAARRVIEASRKAEAGERRRVSGIKARVAKYAGIESVECSLDATGLPAETGGTKQTIDLVAHAIEHGWTADQAELVALRCARPGPGVGGPHVYSTTTPEVSEAVLEAAVLDAARHQFQLEDDGFYTEATPDRKGVMRRVSADLQKQAQCDFKPGGRYTDQVRQYAHTLFKGQISPKQIFHAAFSRWGRRRQLDLSGQHGVRDFLEGWHYFEQRQRILGEGASDLSISNILSNVQNKFALQGYLFCEQAWREFCAIRNVKDFKPTKSINLLGNAMFQKVGPTGELQNLSFGDQAFSNQAENYGIIGTIPWTSIVNDDLSMLTGAPQKIGQGAGLALNDVIWTLKTAMAGGTVNGDDGNAFWRTTSDTTAASKRGGKAYKPNKQSGGGSVFGDTGLKAAMALFWNQIDPNGNPLGFDGMVPVLLHGPTLWRDVTAQAQAPAIVYGGASAALAPNANPWQGKFKPVMSRYVENANYVNSTTAWWLLFNPVALPVMEVCFLNGSDTPAVLQAGPDFQFDRLGISIRGTMPFGVNVQNFRGGVYSAGA